MQVDELPSIDPNVDYKQVSKYLKNKMKNKKKHCILQFFLLKSFRFYQYSKND